MQLSRRDFLRLSVPVTGLAGLFVIGAAPTSKLIPIPLKASPKISLNTTAKAVLYDTSKCTGCRACETACRKWNKLSLESKPTDLSPKTWTLVKFKQTGASIEDKWLYSKWQCMHCVQPTCMTVCPVQAIYKTEEGPVLYDESKCIGCQYCVTACPFHVPKFDWEKRVIRKCTMCADRIANGLEPACVEVCKAKALTFGGREAILARANDAEAKGAQIYGKNEIGGTSWIYISNVTFDERDFPTVGNISYPNQSRGIWISQIATMGVVVALIWGLSWYLKNRAKQEGRI